jgi:serine/threonine protein kinase
MRDDEHPSPSADPLIGAELGDYRPVRLLGKGGMGAVYEAEDLALGRTVALKVLLPEFAEDIQARRRFQREIEHAVAIEHPHIVPVYNAGFERPHFYIAMRLVRGPDLNRSLGQTGLLPEVRALRILGQIASALDRVHAEGLVHRDIKPHNVLLWGAGTDDEHAMLTDFGIAKALNDTSSLTGVGAIGTPAYMAPEVCLGRMASAASDQYSLGCLAFELLTGRVPHDVDPSAMREAHVEQRPPGLGEIAPHVSAATCRAVDKALQKEPGDRHVSVRAFVNAAKDARESFDTAEAVAEVMNQAPDITQIVATLARNRDLSDARISHITEIDRTEIVRLRRRQARAALVGRRGPSGGTRRI